MSLLPHGQETTPLTFANRHEWAARAEAYLRHETAAQLAAVKRGLAQIVPSEALHLFTAIELEGLVMCESDWSAEELRRGAEVRGKHVSA